MQIVAAPSGKSHCPRNLCCMTDKLRGVPWLQWSFPSDACTLNKTCSVVLDKKLTFLRPHLTTPAHTHTHTHTHARARAHTQPCTRMTLLYEIHDFQLSPLHSWKPNTTKNVMISKTATFVVCLRSIGNTCLVAINLCGCVRSVCEKN